MSVILYNSYIINDYIRDGLQLFLDAGNTSSYPVSGTTWTDLSGNNRTGTLTNGPLTYNTNNSGSLEFTAASNQYVQCTGSITTSAATFFAFIRRSGDLLNFNGIIFSRGTNTVGMNTFDTNATIRTGLGYHWTGGNGGFSSLQIPNTTWCMVALTIGSGAITGYLGQSTGITSSSVAETITSFTLNNIQIGGDSAQAGRYFNGRFSVAMIYNKVLSSSEITQNFNFFKHRYGF